MDAKKLYKLSDKVLPYEIGSIHFNNVGEKMVIVEKMDDGNVVIEFQDDYHYRKKVYCANLKNGRVRNPYYKNIFNVGCLGETYGETLETSMAYSYWHSMIRRCYSKKDQLKNPTYSICTVCKEWQCYENFKKWFDENYYEIPNEIMCLDKDILIKNNKEYSPQTCAFVPVEINGLFTKRQNGRGDYPIGVTYHKRVGMYVAKCSIGNGERKHLGYFDSPKEAFYRYKEFKEKHIKQVADKYKPWLPQNVYNAMYLYEVEITD